MNIAEHYIINLDLVKHPEGGYYKEVYRSEENVLGECLPARYTGSRSFCTSIYFLLKAEDFSSFHRIKSDELWHFYDGDPVTVWILTPSNQLNKITLGKDIDKGMIFQAVITKGSWFAAQCENKHGFSLVGCTVSPGFDFKDFELADKQVLLNEYPEHKEIISRLTI